MQVNLSGTTGMSNLPYLGRRAWESIRGGDLCWPLRDLGGKMGLFGQTKLQEAKQGQWLQPDFEGV